MKINFSPLKTFFTVMAAFVVLMMASCYPDDSLSYDETDIVMTGYYDSVDFHTLNTYYMSDTVYPIREDSTDKSLIDNNNMIIDLIAQNMATAGYTRITEVANDTPDVRIYTAAISVTNVSVGTWYPYYPGWGWGWGWGWKSSERGTDYYYPGYPGYYPPGWGWGYPYYSSYTTGTLVIEMYDPNNIRVFETDTVTPIYWEAGINGVLSSSDSDRITKSINKAFEMSPEIKTN